MAYRNSKTMSRRSLIGGAGAVTVAAGARAVSGFPTVHAQEPKVLRYLGTAVNQSPDIARKVKEDTGIAIEYIPVTTDDVTRRVITQPNSFDIVDTEYFSLKKLVPSGNLLAMDGAKIKNFDKITPVFTKGALPSGKVIGSMGEYKYPDKGNMTKEEIDRTMKVLTEAKKAGQFRAFWKDFNESVNLMASGETVIQSMWSPAVTAVKSKGIPCVYQPLAEGYRAWAAGFALSKGIKGTPKADLAYEFVNWFLDGWAGAYLNRQGYYSAVLDTAKAKMEPYEWAFWMEGKPAEKDIKAPDGTLLEKAGAKRDGGSYDDRMGGVACWNAVMDENDYMVKKWNEFIAA